jgi:sialic acid synthase SpsE/sugar phosphate isomerase/epimerase
MLIEKNISLFSVDYKSKVIDLLKYLESSEIKFSCVLSSDNTILGVVSFGDIVSELTKGDFDLNMPVSKIMNTEYVYSFFGNDQSTLKTLLAKYRFIPLVDYDKRLQALVYGTTKNREFKIADYKINSESDFLLIAEIGNNHNGSLERAFKLIDAANANGAHVVKFQMRDLDTLYGDRLGSFDLSTEYVINLLNKVSLDDESLFRCFDYCHKKKITPLCTPFDLTSLEKLQEYGLEGYKIASADLTNHQLYQAIINTKKPIITSTGMSSDEDIDAALSLLEKNHANFAICHANSTYPTPYTDINLNYFHNLKSRTDAVVGYSGHERGWHITTAAFALGAQVIEKHLTLDKSLEGNDHKVSLLPEEFGQMSKAIKDVSEAMGDGHKRIITQGESANRVALGKAIFCTSSLKKGDIIKKENLEIRSPGTGLSPRFYNQLIGKTIQRNVEAGDSFFGPDISNDSLGHRYIFPQKFLWAIPVRHRDVYQLVKIFNPPAIEFHLSFKDLAIKDHSVLKSKLNVEVIVHAPEQFDEDFVIDLFTSCNEIGEKSVSLLNKVFRKAESISDLLGYAGRPKVIINCGGHSKDSFLAIDDAMSKVENFKKWFHLLEIGNCRFLAQTMPPYPWHFGGQAFHNQFTSLSNILEILKRVGSQVELCFDISHSYMWCNFAKQDFDKFTSSIIDYVSHVHISDASGLAEEGLQIGEGDVDFKLLLKHLIGKQKDLSILPEIWQGHENNGEGFKIALLRLNELGY